MIAIFQILYAVVILVFLLLSLFIVYHLLKYSYDKKVTSLMVTIFVVFTGLLIFSNIILFLNLPLEDLFYNFL